MDVGEPEEADRRESLSPSNEAPGPTVLQAPPAYILDLYKISVDMADKVSARRATANSFFLTIHTGLAAFVGVLVGARDSKETGALPKVDEFGLTVTALAGVTLAMAWWLLLRSYRDLNAAKFNVILDLEREHLPLRPFSREWEYLKRDPLAWWRPRYAELGFVERVVPLVFMIVYGVLAVRVWSS